MMNVDWTLFLVPLAILLILWGITQILAGVWKLTKIVQMKSFLNRVFVTLGVIWLFFALITGVRLANDTENDAGALNQPRVGQLGVTPTEAETTTQLREEARNGQDESYDSLDEFRENRGLNKDE